MADWEAERLIARLENAAQFLDICAKHPQDMRWELEIIERKYTVMDVLRQAAEYLKTGTLPEEE